MWSPHLCWGGVTPGRVTWSGRALGIPCPLSVLLGKLVERNIKASIIDVSKMTVVYSLSIEKQNFLCLAAGMLERNNLSLS